MKNDLIVTACVVIVFAGLMAALIHATRKSHKPFRATYVMPSHGIRRHRWTPRHVGGVS